MKKEALKKLIEEAINEICVSNPSIVLKEYRKLQKENKELKQKLASLVQWIECSATDREIRVRIF